MIHTWPRWPAITVWECPREPLVSVHGDHQPPPGSAALVEPTWRRLQARNPRLFDGPILALQDFAPSAAEVRCTRTSFRWLSVQDDLDAGVVLVAVNGVVTARDRFAREHILLGRRSLQNRIYPGMWELSPAGGIEPPAQDGVADTRSLHEQLRRELREECGLQDPIDPRPWAFYRDTAARSFNIVYRVELRRLVEDLSADTRPAHWDCDTARWIPRHQVPSFLRDNPVIDASRALLSRLGWAG